MTWSYKWGEHVQSGFYDSLLEQGRLKPEDIQPDTTPFNFYIEAFFELSSCRVSGMSVGPIPFTAIVEYSKLFDVGDFEEFHYIIRQMDNKFLSLEAARVKSSTESAGKKK